jgi:predicted secreted protein
MKKQIPITILVLLFAIGIATLPGTSAASQGAFSTANPDGDPINVNEAHNGQTVTVVGDQVLVVDLEGNPTTGYSWAVLAVDGSILRQVGETEFEPYYPERIGSPGRQTLRFRATGEGTTTLSLAYRRSWEAAPGLGTFSIHVQTRGPFSAIVDEATSKAAPPPSPEDLGPIATDAVPSSYNWCDEGGCTPVKDQGGCGSCWAFATSGVVESLIKIGDGVTRDLSEQYLVSCNAWGWGCTGGSRAFDFFIDEIPPGESAAGAVYEAEYPYINGGTMTTQPCTGQPHTHHETLVSWGMQYGTPPPATIKQLIYDYGPVYVSMCASGPVFNSYSGGIYQTDESAYCGGGTDHGVVLVGWDDNQGSGVWYLRNSWGTLWGENGGYMRIAYGVSNVGRYPAYAVYEGNPNHPPNTPTNPSPADGALTQPIDSDLAWTGGDPDSGDTVTYDVYLEAGDTSPDVLVCNDVSVPACNPGTLTNNLHYYWTVVATDSFGETITGTIWSFWTPTYAGPLVYNSHTIDDTTSGDSIGDGDGVIECGETIEMDVSLYHQGSVGATGVSGSISTDASIISWPYNTSSTYPDVAPGGTVTDTNDFDFAVHPLAREGRVVTFDLEFSTDTDVWTDSFTVTVHCDVDHPTTFFPIVALNQVSGPPLANGDFESGRDGSWSEYSSNGFNLIVHSTELLPGQLPHHGDWAAWLGGWVNETSILSQTVGVPSTATTLDYWYWIGSYDGCGDDYAYVRFGTSTLETYDLCSAENTNGWVYGQIDVTSWRGQTVDLAFVTVLDGVDNSNFFLDDVSFGTDAAPRGTFGLPDLVPVPIDAAAPRETP